MTDLFYRPHHKPFSGRVIDGPFEGEWIESESPFFMGEYQEPLFALYTGWPAGLQLNRALYKWIMGYRAWAWVQPDAKR